jgi:hypothetical protein
MTSNPASERRQQNRICFRTSLTVITIDPTSNDIRPLLTEAWTEDVSLTGAQILTRVPVREGKVWMRFIMPGSSDRLVEAEIVRRSTKDRGNFRKFPDAMHLYGVKFSKVISEPSVIDWLLSAIHGEPLSEIPEQVQARIQSIRQET